MMRITLQQHLEAVLAEMDRRYEQRFQAQEKALEAALHAVNDAVNVTAVNAEKWRIAANEWRGAMDDRERLLMPRSLAEEKFVSIQRTLDTLQANQNVTMGGSKMVWALFGSIGIVVALAMAVVKLWH